MRKIEQVPARQYNPWLAAVNGAYGQFKHNCSRVLLMWTALLTLISGSAIAADKVSIAVVDPVAALSETNQAKSMMDKFRKDAEPEAQKAKKLEDELKAIMEKSQKDLDIMSASQKAKLEKEIEDKRMDYTFIRQKLQKRQKEGRDQILQALGPKFEEAMNNIIKKGQYEIILHKQAVFHSKASIDITAEVTKEINKMK